ncbi:hypothetical protein [Nocardia abscessus]|uniref:Secreted protein n=1 Tax=Nocardia abscessus TaxID=120957 RepID=A0ABS0CF75_9NOCA|nr:hypothetical protein [Nocardia abscessus]MBF6228997.1 hypothetical protein [Nocardia abscessus]
MNGSTIARAAAAAVSLGIGAVLTFSAPAIAEQPQTPVDAGLAHLTHVAGADPSTQEGVAALRQYAALVDAANLRDVSSVFTPFSYAAPTFGCGSNGPITTIIAAATTDGSGTGRDLNVAPGELRFSATPSHSGAPLASGLVVAWVNVNTGASGIDPLDDVTEYRLPSLSKTVRSGPGTVIASMWGIIDYPFAHCVMTPTVGLFTVPDYPAPPPAAPAPAQPGPSGSGGGPTP